MNPATRLCFPPFPSYQIRSVYHSQYPIVCSAIKVAQRAFAFLKTLYAAARLLLITALTRIWKIKPAPTFNAVHNQRPRNDLLSLDIWLNTGGTETTRRALIERGSMYSGCAALPLTREQRTMQLQAQWRLPSLKGSYPSFAYLSLKDTIIQAKIPKEAPNRALEIFRRARKVFTPTIDNQLRPAKDVAQDILDNQIVVIPTGWRKSAGRQARHSTAIVFAGKRVMKCNRGEGASTPGISVFELPINPPPTVKRLARCVETLRQKISRDYYNHGIDRELRIRPVSSLTSEERSFCSRKYQKGPTCAMSSAKTAWAAVLFAVSGGDLSTAQWIYKWITNQNRKEGVTAAQRSDLATNAPLMSELEERKIERSARISYHR